MPKVPKESAKLNTTTEIETRCAACPHPSHPGAEEKISGGNLEHSPKHNLPSEALSAHEGRTGGAGHTRPSLHPSPPQTRLYTVSLHRSSTCRARSPSPTVMYCTVWRDGGGGRVRSSELRNHGESPRTQTTSLTSIFTHARGDGSPHAGYVPPRARTHQFSSVQFSAGQLPKRIPTVTAENGQAAAPWRSPPR